MQRLKIIMHSKSSYYFHKTKNLNMKRILFYLSIILMTSSCVSMRLQDVSPKGKNSVILPTLKPHVDIKSFENTYYGLSPLLIESHPVYYGTDIWGVDVTETTVYNDADPRIQDAISIFIKDVKENITNPYGERQGDILCRITFGDVNSRGYEWFLLSIATLYIPNLLGMPLLSNRSTIELEVQIFDLNKNLIGRYTADCTNKKYVALYWGSAYPTAARRANAAAFMCAMYKIKKQIDLDAPKLIAKLKRAKKKQ